MMSAQTRRGWFAEQRHLARALAMQALFEADFSRRPPEDVLRRRLEEEEFPEVAAEYAGKLVAGAWEHREEYDVLIARAAPTWPLEQMARVDHNILRVALFEMLHGREVPIKAAINEAVELAKEYGSDASRRFVNGVLGTIASEAAERQGDGPVAQEEP